MISLPHTGARAIVLGLALGCAPRAAPTPTSDAAPPRATPKLSTPEQPGAEPRPGPDADRDACDPLPREGEPCQHEGSVCPIDWGQPCGASTAAWCEAGVWIYEMEANLCDEDLSG